MLRSLEQARCSKRERDSMRIELNATETALVGTESGSRVSLGDPISVQVSRVDAERGMVDLEPAGSD